MFCMFLCISLKLWFCLQLPGAIWQYEPVKKNCLINFREKKEEIENVKYVFIDISHMVSKKSNFAY